MNVTVAGDWLQSFACRAISCLVLILAMPLSAQNCANISGTWQVEDQTTIIYNIAGQISTNQTGGSGPLPIQQTGCQIHFVSEGINPIDGSIIQLSRDGTVTGSNVTYSGQTGVIIPGATCSQNNITGMGVVEGDTMRVTNTGLVSCSVQGIPIVVTIYGVSVFTRAAQGLNLTGEIRLDSPTGAPAVGMTVRLTGGATQQTQTDSSGRYTFSGLQPGNYTVAPEGTGFIFEPTSQTVNLTQNAELPVFVALRIPGLRIGRVWSDQLELPQGESNFLPPATPGDLAHSRGAGRVGNAHNYILMAARSDDKGYVKARFELTPPDSVLREKVVLRLARVDDPARTPIGNVPVVNGDIVSLSVELNQFPAPPNALVGYLVIGWIDVNGNGVLDTSQGEVLVKTEPPSQLIIIPRAYYLAAQLALGVGALQDINHPFNVWEHPVAANFLGAFVSGTDPTKATRRRDSSVCADGELDFNVGSIFDISGCGFIYLYEFDRNSEVAGAVLGSRACREAATVTVEINRQRIQDEFNSNPDTNEVVCELVGNERENGTGIYTGSKLLVFRETDPDMKLAFGTATLKDATLTIRRDNPDVAVVRGTLADLYDWNYETHPYDRMAAAIQAGYSTLGRDSIFGDGGRVFRLNVFLDAGIRGIRVDGAPFLSIGQVSNGQNGLRLTVSGAIGSRLSLEDSTDLVAWTQFRDVVLSNVIEDVELPLNLLKPKQFFRATVVNP